MRYSSLCADLTLQDITNARLDEDHETKVLALKDTAYSKNYRTVCLPLTTAKWKERWTGMCLVPFDAGDEESAKTAREAEKWRLNPAFEMGEVTMTRLGTRPASFTTNSTNLPLDEADCVTILVSEWLELDADDDGVRHDAEIVRPVSMRILLLFIIEYRLCNKSWHMLVISIYSQLYSLRPGIEIMLHLTPASSIHVWRNYR